MRFTVNALNRCSGQSHYHVNITVNGVARQLHFTREELQDEISDFDEARARVLIRLRSAVKEANATTFAQARTALETKEFQV
jgi:hypothetical protein